MHLILDANVYIFGFGLAKNPNCAAVLTRLTDNFSFHTLSICRTIVQEVNANLTLKEARNFFEFINIITTIDEDFVVPFELGVKYEMEGLKPADAFIAAYTEWVGAEVLVTENRHFLARHHGLPFKILTAEKFLKLI